MVKILFLLPASNAKYMPNKDINISRPTNTLKVILVVLSKNISNLVPSNIIYIQKIRITIEIGSIPNLIM